MSPEAVQAILADFQRRATLVERRADGRQTWRFDVDAHAYALHFYPDDDTAIRKYLGGADAAREFSQLQNLQKLAIPATRVIANLKGFRLGDRKGDACIVVVDARDVPFDALLQEQRPRREWLESFADLLALLESLHRNQLCPTPLHVHGFARRGDRTIVADGGVRLAGVVDPDRLAELDFSTRHVTTAADRLRVWKHFRTDPPRSGDRAWQKLAAGFAREARDGERHFGAIECDGPSGDHWAGRFVSSVPLTLPWSRANGLHLDRDFWAQHIPSLLNPTGESLKDDRAARIQAGVLQHAGTTIPIVIKRPHANPGILRALRRSRVMRAWVKTWRMLALGFACEVPLLVLERRRGPRVMDQLLVVERVPGQTLATIDFDALLTPERSRLLHATGRVLRRIESLGATHCDAKASNWIAWTNPAGQVRPVLIDLDGVRFYRWRGMGIERLTRALRLHSQIRDADLHELTAGYRGPRG